MDERDRAAHVTEPSFVAETLAWCNEKRAEQGRRALNRLPKGERESGSSCPCGKATALYVDEETFAATLGEWYKLPSTERNRLPSPVVRFVRAFDAGELPQYDLYPASEAHFDSDAPAGASSPPGTAPESAGNSPGTPDGTSTRSEDSWTP